LVAPEMRESARIAAANSMSAESWLADRIEGASLTWKDVPQKIMLHGHCHQKALWGTGDTCATGRRCAPPTTPRS
jgi:hypothetical protein